tara:strand:- start:512 stop:1408 length:897 start_codon:yes stop_codon:yes gene_type:complete
MSSFLKNLKSSIEKLNQIDLGREISKLSQIKLEDLKNISFADLGRKVNPMALSVVGGVAFFGVGFYWLTLPEWRSWSENSLTLNQYRLEAEEVPVLRATLDNLKAKQESISQEFDIVRGFVSEESVELFTSKFFSETARRANVRLLGVTPMEMGEPFACIQTDQPELALDEPPPPPPEPSGLEQPEDPSTAPPATPPPLETAFQSDLSGIFKVNRFQLSLRGNYLNVMDYLRYLNQYQQSISPLCFEVFSTPIPPPTGDSASAEGNPEPRYVGEVNAKLIVDVPQREISEPLEPDSSG